MSFFDQVYEKLFPKGNTQPVTVQKVLHRNERYMEEYSEWQTKRRALIIKTINNSLQLSRKEIEQNPPVHLLSSKGSNGFALGYSEIYTSSELQFLLDWFAEKVLANFRYKRANADITIVEKGKQVETIEKYYLKPKNDFDPPIDQQFGNILIENSLMDNQPNYLKFMANTYSDRNYTEARNLDELIDFLLKPDN
ncbi:MAG: hypothetical protein AAGA85_03315 [Bacteroidota bacterium]